MIYVTHDQVEAMTMADKIVVLRAGRIEQVGSPLDLYNEPNNSFVAGFIGSPRMNFIDAVVETVNERSVVVRDAAGARFEASVDGAGLEPGACGQRSASAPSIVTFGAGGGKPATVQTIEQLGGDSYLHCVAEDGAALAAHLPGQTAIRRGDAVNVVFRPDFTHLFRKSDGAAQKRLVIGEAV